jgi:hypothetical protein
MSVSDFMTENCIPNSDHCPRSWENEYFKCEKYIQSDGGEEVRTIGCGNDCEPNYTTIPTTGD